MKWWYVFKDKHGRIREDRLIEKPEFLGSLVVALMVDGEWTQPHGQRKTITFADWRWSQRWKRFTIIDTAGNTHIIKQVNT